MTRLWAWLAAGVGLLLAALMLVIGQRDRAREKAKQARINLQSSEASRAVDATARKAQESARAQSQEVHREADKRDSGTRPSGEFRR